MVQRHGKLLPDVVVIGAMKAGTTTLYEYFAAHPAVGVSAEKETDFFVAEKNWRRGPDWYHAQFRPGFQRYAEISPNYSKARDFPGVPGRLAETLPECRLIYIARDPVARAISQYSHSWLAGIDVPPPEGLRPETHAFQHLIDASLYHAQLQAFLAHVPLERILVLDFEAFVADPAPTLSRIAGFIGVENRWPAPSVAQANNADTLSRTPPWFFRLRETPIAAAIKQRVPRGVANRVRQAIATGPKRQVPEIGAAIRDQIAEAVAVDTARFRALTGQGFPHWTV